MRHKRIEITALLSIFCLTTCGSQLSGQNASGAFQIAVPVGANLAQVAGDPYSGMRKWGLSVGVEGIAQLTDDKQMSLGFLFQQVGSAPGITERKKDEQNYIDMHVSYIELPLMFHWQFREQKHYYKMDGQIGFSLARQLSSRIVRTQTLSGSPDEFPFLGIVDRQEAFENFTWNGVIGLSYYFHPRVALRVRYHHGLTHFFQPTEEDAGLEDLSHRYFSMSVRYIIL